MSLAALPELFRLASTQGGYFTAKQAEQCGWSRQLLSYHLQAGNVERVGRGLYRQPLLPRSQHDDLIRVCLWSRDIDDHAQAVASHATALSLHGLSDVLPSQLHFTVPPSFRKPAPRGCELHRANLSRAEIAQAEGYALTTALRTLQDVGASGSVTREQYERACQDALRRGMVRSSELVRLRRTLRTSPAPRPARRGRK